MAANIGTDPVTGEERANRFCPVCRQVDDHPRHVTSLDPDPSVAKHMDCCAEQGCPTGHCHVARDGLDPSVVGADFLAHLLTLDHAPGGEIAQRAEALMQERHGMAHDPNFAHAIPVVNLEGAN